jgi:hypothetical protein
MDETDRRRPLRRRNLDVSFINKFVHRGPAAPLGCRPPVLYQRPPRRLDSSAQLQLESTAMIFRPRLHAQAKYYLQLNIFTTSISFVDMLYMFFLLFQSPLDMLRGLAMPTRLCYVSLHLDKLGGLAMPI